MNVNKAQLPLELKPMPSEYKVDLCFIRPQTDASYPFSELEVQMHMLFSAAASCYVERKREEGLDIAIVQVNGLSCWRSEQEVILHMETCMQPETLEWLSGYRIQVIPKAYAGTCRLKR